MTIEADDAACEAAMVLLDGHVTRLNERLRLAALEDAEIQIHAHSKQPVKFWLFPCAYEQSIEPPTTHRSLSAVTRAVDELCAKAEERKS